MGDRRRVRCQDCGRHRSEAGDISWRGLCRECGERRNEQNYDQVQARNGPFFQRWRERTAASVGASILDDQRAKP